MVDPLPLRIFLATPGDLVDERAAVRACVDEHNARSEGANGIRYEVVEWNQVRGTVRRAQEAIDELIAESHFMIALFKNAWGSTPGSTWGYTSGTEEELFTGLLELGQAEQPMRDLWVGFVKDPAPDNRILTLRQNIINTYSVMFESITDLRDLKVKLADRLRSWEELAGAKTPRHVDLMPSSGKDVLRAANLRLRGEKLVELGQPDTGRALLRESAALGGPVEKLAYARVLRRAGDLEGAYTQTQNAIDYFAEDGLLYSALAADAFSAQARVLNDQGCYLDAIGRLERALTLLTGNDAYAQVIRCRIQDDLGLAYMKVEDLPGARRNFEAALQMRRDAGRDHEVCQSLINLARLEIAADDLPTAAGYADEVVLTLRGTPPSSLHANAGVLAAQVRLRQSRPEEGIPQAEWALAVNRQIANKNGEAISLLLLAQCCRAAGRRTEAEEHARACLALNESMENARGAEKAKWLLDRLPAS
ncbi:Tetratricopeptide repeat-containing protein [Nakamurella panacisegetis]|uniref:Tetratricopeptide repeat-containing protein n=1 Tax=Nakamurella panacisegetis TaxID=1090615 RepID=A0A1H0LES1_9ACTN|nr:tetratricopeptide repeat protein [Nakamurella panacisegetis]SDO66490.1 Tetratricopeptide repeat-containing protein [Nakamurella panacisegetis]